MPGNRPLRYILAALVAALIAFFGLIVASNMAQKPSNIGLVDGKLRSCEGWPNCVCSEDFDDSAGEGAMQPIPYKGPAATAMETLVQVVSRMSGARIVTQSDHYMHAEFTSSVFRFTDDVEFRIDEEASVIHFRSASRVGLFDLGANRARMEKVAAQFAATDS